MATLYEIDAEILNCIDAETGEIIDFDKLQELQLARDEKIENVALWYKNLMSDAEQYKAEKDAFAEKEKAAKKKAEGLKAYLENALQGAGFKTTRVNVTWRKSEKVEIDDLFALDDCYLNYSEPKPDKTAIKAAIKDGLEIKGAHIETCNNMSIK